MKKRIVSLLLLVCMLVTAIPVMASAEEVQSVASTSNVDYDYHDRYLTDGLVGLFTAFDANDASVTLADGKGTWANRVNDQLNATFSGKDWAAGANGGVGYKLVFGTINASGVYSTASTDNRNNFENYNKLVFGLDLLPEEDYTVEYVALYTPLYAWDVNTSSLVPALSAKDANGNTPAGKYSEMSVDMLGILHSIDCYRGGLFDGSTGAVRWRVAPKAVWGDASVGSSWGDNKGTYGGFGNSNNTDNRATGEVATYTIIHDRLPDTIETIEEVETTVYNAYYYHYYKNEKAYKVGNTIEERRFFSSKYATNTAVCYYVEGGDTDFWLSLSSGTDFYAVRIYDKVLSAEDRAYNAMIDVLEWYNIKAGADFFASEIKVDRVLAAAATAGFLTDAVARAAKAAELQALVDSPIFADAKEYYVQDGLVELFSIYGDDAGVDLAAGTWTGALAGNKATFKNKANWSVNENGSIGFTSFCGVIVEGAYAKTGTGNGNNYTAGNRLAFDMSLLPSTDFTVEYMAMYKPLYVYDAAQTDKIAKNADGSKMETYSKDEDTTGLFVGQPSVDNLGWFQSIAAAIDGKTYKDWNKINGVEQPGDQTRGAAFWVVGFNNGDSSAWYADSSSRQGWWLGGKSRTRDGGLHLLNNPYNTNDQVRTYAITVDETVTNAGDTEALFTLYRDAVAYNSNANSINSTAKTGGNQYFAKDYDDTCRFWLANNRPVDFFGVRIYDRALTSSELAINRMTDLICYYDLKISANILADAELLDTLAGALAGVPFATDAVTKAAALQQIESIIEFNTKTSLLYSLYVQNGLVANYTALSSLDASASVENGGWSNRVSGGASATFGNAQYWHKNANGSVGFNIFYGSVDANGTYSTSGTYNNYTVLGTKLDLGIANLPKADFTVEFVAQINPVYAADANGKPAGEAYLLNGNTPGSQQYQASLFQLGYLGGWTTNIDGVHTNHAAYKRSALAWAVGGGYNWGADCGFTRMDCQTAPVTSDAFLQNGVVHSYAITRNEYTDKADETTIAADYSLIRDAIAHTTFVLDSSTKSGNANWIRPDFSEDDGGTFVLSHRISTDFYAVRVYNRVLDGTELVQNHMIDIVAYYDLTLPAAVYASEAVLSAVASALEPATIVKDQTAAAANKIAYQALIERIVAAATATSEYDYADLYVKDGLVGLFTAFTGDPSVDLVNSTWKNKVDNAYGDATFRGGSAYWQLMGKGVGYSFNYAQYSADRRNVGLSLPESFATLSDFTVETFATAVGITNDDGSRYVNIYTAPVKDESGNVVTPASGAIYGHYITGNSTFRFELLCTVFFNSLYYNGTNYNREDSLGQRWFICNYGYNGNPSGDNGVTIYSGDQTWRTVGDPMVPTALVMQTMRSVDATSGNITYSIAYNNAAVASGMTSTITADQHATFSSKSGDEVAGRFSLFNGLPGIVYAIRVYNDLLTDAEKAQNRLVDLMYYHDVAVPAGLADDAAAMAAIAECANAIKISEDAVQKAANKATIENAIAKASCKVDLVVNGEVADTLYAVGGTYELPATIGEKTVIAWKSSTVEGNLLPGEAVATETEMSLTAVVVDAPATNTGVSIKPMSDTAGLGMRFTADFERETMETIFELYDNVSVGMLIAPVQYVQAAGGVFTREALRAYVTANAVSGDRAFVEIKATGFYIIDDETLTLAGTIYNFSATTKAKNPDFTAVAYIDIDADNDGIVDYTVYGSYNMLAKYNVKSVMQKALNSGKLTDTQNNWITGLLKSFGA